MIGMCVRWQGLEFDNHKVFYLKRFVINKLYMKNIIYAILISLVFICGNTSCEEIDYTTKSSVCGTVIEATDNTPIEGVIVTNLSTGENCITKVDGRYEFHNLYFGKTYKIYAEKDGYVPSSQSIAPSRVPGNIELNIRLEKRP